MAVRTFTKAVWVAGVSSVALLVCLFFVRVGASRVVDGDIPSTLSEIEISKRNAPFVVAATAETRSPGVSQSPVALKALPSLADPSGLNRHVVGPRAMTVQERRIKTGPLVIKASGNASQTLQRRGTDLRANLHQSLIRDFGDRVELGNIDCFRAGCVMRITFKDIDASMKFRTHVLKVDAFTDWPGPKLFVSLAPDSPVSAEDWCFWSSAEEARTMLAVE